MTKETYTTILARLDERLKGLVETNNNAHNEIMGSIKELKIHVNDEILAMNKRVSCLENESEEKKAEKKGQLKIYKIAVAALGLLSTLLVILSHLKVI